MNQSVSIFKSQGYDPFIDYLKGICIIWVIMDHSLSPSIHDYTLFCAWGDMAVPIFLIIQCVHAFKKQPEQVSIKWGKLWERIIRPFLLVELCLFLLGLAKYVIFGDDVLTFFSSFITSGGMGRGSYFSIIYIQFAIIIPFIYPILKNKCWIGGGILLMASIVSEVIFSYYDNEKLWRLICCRYLFIIFFGYIITSRSVILNVKIIAFSIISLIILLFFYYSHVSLEPIFYDNSWRIYRWPSYFYVTFMLTYVVWRCFIVSPFRIKGLIQKVGKNSYKIFLFQMLVFYIIDGFAKKLHMLDSAAVNIIYCFFVIVVCIYPILKYEYSSSNKNIILSL